VAVQICLEMPWDLLPFSARATLDSSHCLEQGAGARSLNDNPESLKQPAWRPRPERLCAEVFHADELKSRLSATF